MDNYVRDVYLWEAVTQCKFALNALKGLHSVLTRLFSADGPRESSVRQTLHDEVFRSLHSFLTHASNVSRLFWPALPARRKNEDQGAYDARCLARPSIHRALHLRRTISLPDDHALASRKLRDHLEHFDERLDDWATSSKRRNFVQDFIGGRDGITGVDEGDMMRWFDPTDGTIRFRGEAYALRQLSDGVAEVLEACSARLGADDADFVARDLSRAEDVNPPAG